MINEATVTALKICFWILVGFFLMILLIECGNDILGVFSEIIDQFLYGSEDPFDECEIDEYGNQKPRKSKEKLRREVKRERRRRRRYHQWRLGLHFLNRNHKRQREREKDREYKRTRKAVVDEIAHSLAIHEEIVDNLYSEGSTSIARNVYRAYKNDKQRSRGYEDN